ncbi:hypothetical protein [Herbaspirillum rhizosphaerae]|uniref:hypothetical protein n=1 Tax=Herbaspirillum rhizosphaerae TaxID=346179 RepID=UPI00067B1DB0|nr:hypothetical protein [Herbaspirillum rhizosphaerae]
MARNPVTPVRPVDAVVSARPVDSGSTYYRHLELWRITSEVNAAARRAKEPRARDADFLRALSDAGFPDLK